LARVPALEADDFLTNVTTGRWAQEWCNGCAGSTPQSLAR